MNTDVHQLVLTALRGEAYAHARYRLFAAAARSRGDERLASLREGMANVELDEHFAELAELAGLVGSDADNILAALQDENDEAELTYPEFAARARAAGEDAVAERFEELAADERGHAHSLESELEAIEVPT
jgi:rubrerythrin